MNQPLMLGTLVDIDLKVGLISHAVLPLTGELYYDGGDLVLKTDAESQPAIERHEGCPVISLAYRTDRFEGRRTEHGARIDRRPFEHSFVRRPRLERDMGSFRLRKVDMQFDQLGQPTFIKG